MHACDSRLAFNALGVVVELVAQASIGFAAMPNFNIDDVLAEARQVAELLQSRPPAEREQLGQGLLKGILFKLDGMRLTAGDVLKFSVVLANLPSEFKEQLQAAWIPS